MCPAAVQKEGVNYEHVHLDEEIQVNPEGAVRFLPDADDRT